MEVLMRKLFVGSLTSLSLLFLLTIAVHAQSGMRVEANIPFDFAIGDEVFQAGTYRLQFTRQFGDVYNVVLKNEQGRAIMKTLAFKNGKAIPNRSELNFASADGDRILEDLRTPDAGYRFITTGKDKRLAQAKRISVPTETAPN